MNLAESLDASRKLNEYENPYFKNKNQNIFIEDIELGKAFVFREKRVFIKIEKLRKRYKCKEIETNKMYLFSPLAKVSLYK